MELKKWSRNTFTVAIFDEEERLYVTSRVPFRFRELSDTSQHIVSRGESLYTLAAKYYSALPRPAGLWWVIADFQPQPIHDPTLIIPEGTLLFIPSLRTVQEDIFRITRRDETDEVL